MAATFGGTLNLACNVTDVTYSVYGWHKLSIEDKWFTLTDKQKYGGVKRTNLTIKNVDTNDAGVNRCFSYDDIKKSAKYGSNITVVVPGI